MARRTSLYQSPRSPLIQGRTRWERPLWESWLGGAVVAGIAALVVWWLTGRNQLSGQAWLLVGVTLVVLAALGATLARLWGWRMRWIGAALLALAGAAALLGWWSMSVVLVR